MNDRILVWDGCNNVRDLGGLRTAGGRTTLKQAIVRGDSPSRLTEAGWAALHAHGIRTIITLRTHGIVEPELDFSSPYPDILTVQAEIEDLRDTEFVEKWVNNNLWGTPLYFGDALRRWPERHAAVVSAVGRAQPGGVLFHCIRGYDRTGIISLLLLGLAGVIPEDIAADYELSVDSFRDELLANAKTTVLDSIRGTLADIDLDSYLLKAGATQDDLAAVRRRFLG